MTLDTINTAPWEHIAEQKRARRDGHIPTAWLLSKELLTAELRNVIDVPKTCGILSTSEIEITETTATRLIERMLNRDLTSEQVVTAFCKRAAIAQQLTNCLTEIFFTSAIENAQKIDEQYIKTNKPAGPLHGLPVSLKDNVNIEGFDSTVGFLHYCNKPIEAGEESEVTRIMRTSGAVLFCKTNVPTAMLMGDTYNNVWGYTPNPYNIEMNCGGSSGGEAVLQAMRGAPLGIGTDIGGSIRMPSALCGIFGLKAAGGRFPTWGLRAALPGQEALKSVSGPMSSDLSSLELWCKVVLATKPWERDPTMFNIPWRDIQLPEKLCFGLILDDFIVQPTPAVTRALFETKAALEAAGHIVITWTPYDPVQANKLLERFFMGDGGAKIVSLIEASGETWPVSLEPFRYMNDMLKNNPPLVADLWTLQAERSHYLKKALDHWIASSEATGTHRPFDGVISPICAFPSCPKYTFKHAAYAGIWNLTDQTSIAFPVTKAALTDTIPEVTKSYRTPVEKAIWEQYDPIALDGVPIGLQIVCLRHEEEKALKLAEVAVRALEQYNSAST